MKIIPTAAETERDLPSQLSLHGNYPNPFNPTTRIEFSLPQAAEVSLLVFDVLGRKVLSVPGRPFAGGGVFQMEVNASDLPTGLYLYQLHARSSGLTSIASGKMMLIK